MHVLLAVLLVATSIFADQKEDRRTKLPFIADAVGNSLPPPSEVPATVGSPVNLLNPDRYEFYTFDESGELVKRLMTLEEIQAIVAAGEESEGLVTFANENQPTVAFNFTQPSHNKVHSVVTNVQNVLKAQMEAHKKKPIIQPTLDTPDVSDSWSLILPSIFGNSGIDIVPDKSAETFITPETDTIDVDNSQNKEDIALANEPQQILQETTKIPAHTESITTTTNAPSSTTKKIISAATKPPKPKITTTRKRVTTTTTFKPTPTPPTTTTTSTTTTTTTTTTARPSPTTTTRKAITAKFSTTLRPAIGFSATRRPIFTYPIKNKPSKLNGNGSGNSTKLNTNATENKYSNFSNNNYFKNPAYNKKNNTSQYQKISTFVPSTTASYITEKLTTTQITTAQTSTLSFVSSSELSTKSPINNLINPEYKIKNDNLSSSLSPILSIVEDSDKINSTTMTTQSVSPSTILTSTEIISVKKDTENNSYMSEENKKNEPVIPLFDVAQSISQIASDLGGAYSPVPTVSNVQDTNKNGNLPIESKENVEIDIPVESGNEGTPKNSTDFDNFVKISTIDPQESLKNIVKPLNDSEIKPVVETSTKTIIHSSSPLTTTSYNNNIIDPILSESMGDMLSQVMNENTLNQISTSKNDINIEENIVTTQRPLNQSTLGDKSSNTTINKSETQSLTIEDRNRTKDKINDRLLPKSNNTLNNNTPVQDISNEIISSKSPTKEDVNKTEIPLNNSQNKHHTENHVSNEIKKPTSGVETPLAVSNETKISNKTNIQKPQASTSDLNLNISIVNSKINSGNTNLTTNKDKPLDDFKKKIHKVNVDEVANERNNSWKLIPVVPPPAAVVPPAKNDEVEKDNHKEETVKIPDSNIDKNIILDFSQENQGLEVTTKALGEDILQFTNLCNELAFRYWNELIQNIDNKRSFVLSPYSITSMLAMMFMGARGGTSGEMNDVLRLDDMVTFNPHFTLKNISDSIITSSSSGVAISAFIRELYSEKSKGKILTFYKERAQHFYNGHVEEISFKLISDIIRRRTNLLVKRYTWGRIPEYMKTNSISMNPPLAAFSANIFETDCSGSSVEGRDGEMYFVVSPTVRQRRLVPVPAVVYKSNFLAGYDPVLDATAAALGNTNSIISTLFLMPGQQGNVVHAEDLETLEKRLLNSTPATQTWNRLLRTLLPRVGLELQIPRFSHKSIFNVTSTLQKMGLKELFDRQHADLAGMNGPSKPLHLSDMVQVTTFATCGEGLIGEQHHIEEYPETLQLRRRNSRWTGIWDEPRDYQRAFHDPHDVGDAMHLPLHLRPRQARLPTRNTQPARLKFDRPFLFFVRHNPSGMILYVGRYNPRLLP